MCVTPETKLSVGNELPMSPRVRKNSRGETREGSAPLPKLSLLNLQGPGLTALRPLWHQRQGLNDESEFESLIQPFQCWRHELSSPDCQLCRKWWLCKSRGHRRTRKGPGTLPSVTRQLLSNSQLKTTLGAGEGRRRGGGGFWCPGTRVATVE